MRVYSYVVKKDDGFAPNPFWDYMTMATGQSLIRQVAKPGDWLVGLHAKSEKLEDHYLLFAMKISEKLTFVEYWNDNRFQVKKPEFSEKERIYHVGDNIYEPVEEGFKQHYSLHALDFFESEKEWKKQKEEDLQGKYVLVSQKYEFYYFGKKPEKFPSTELIDLLYCDIGYKCIADPEVPEEFTEFIHQLHTEKKIGVKAKPNDWPKKDDSWEECKSK